MKSIAKRIFTVALSLLMMLGCFFAVACEDIKKIEITFNVYDFEEKEVEEKVITVKLYRHLAKETVDSVIKNVSEKSYYDGVTPYIITGIDKGELGGEAYVNQILLGDLIYENGSFKQNEISVDFVKGEFTAGGVEGSNLKNEEGSIGLWRNKTVNESYINNGSADTGKATLYMPTSSITSRDGYFCVFGKFDLEKEENVETWSIIKNTVDSASNREEYVIYYTGEYNTSSSVKNNGLEFHCIPIDEYEEMDKTNVFMPSGNEFYSYFPTTISAAFYLDGVVKIPAVSVKSVKVI